MRSATARCRSKAVSYTHLDVYKRQPLAYINRVGGQDELVFDGASFVVNGDGNLAVQMKDWEEQEVLTRWTKTAKGLSLIHI